MRTREWMVTCALVAGGAVIVGVCAGWHYGGSRASSGHRERLREIEQHHEAELAAGAKREAGLESRADSLDAVRQKQREVIFRLRDARDSLASRVVILWQRVRALGPAEADARRELARTQTNLVEAQRNFARAQAELQEATRPLADVRLPDNRLAQGSEALPKSSAEKQADLVGTTDFFKAMPGDHWEVVKGAVFVLKDPGKPSSQVELLSRLVTTVMRGDRIVLKRSQGFLNLSWEVYILRGPKAQARRHLPTEGWIPLAYLHGGAVKLVKPGPYH